MYIKSSSRQKGMLHAKYWQCLVMLQACILTPIKSTNDYTNYIYIPTPQVIFDSERAKKLLVQNLLNKLIIQSGHLEAH